MDNFQNYQACFDFILENFPLVYLEQSSITTSKTENHIELAHLLKTNGNTNVSTLSDGV